MRYHVRIRRFLNRVGHETGAYIIAEVPDTTTCHHPGSDQGLWCPCHDLVLQIADCTRVIRLTFNLDTPAERRNGRHKLHHLITALQQFSDAYNTECDRTAARLTVGADS